MASRISRTARSMRGRSMLRSPDIPLPRDDSGQAIQVGEDKRGLRGFHVSSAVDEDRVDVRLGSAGNVGDGIVAHVYYPVASDAAHPQRLLEDRTFGLLHPHD